jgi:hypothetical protein
MFSRVASLVVIAVLAAGCEGHRWYTGHRGLPFSNVVTPNPDHPNNQDCPHKHNPASQTSQGDIHDGSDDSSGDQSMGDSTTPCPQDGASVENGAGDSDHGPVQLTPTGEPASTTPDSPIGAQPVDNQPAANSNPTTPITPPLTPPAIPSLNPDDGVPPVTAGGDDDGGFKIPVRADDPNNPQVKTDPHGLTAADIKKDGSAWVNTPMQELSSLDCSFMSKGEGDAQIVSDFNCDDNGKAPQQVAKIIEFLEKSNLFYTKYVKSDVATEDLAVEVDHLLVEVMDMQRTARTERERLRMFFNIAD